MSDLQLQLQYGNLYSSITPLRRLLVQLTPINVACLALPSGQADAYYLIALILRQLNCFETVLFQFHFNCADSFSFLLRIKLSVATVRRFIFRLCIFRAPVCSRLSAWLCCLPQHSHTHTHTHTHTDTDIRSCCCTAWRTLCVDGRLQMQCSRLTRVSWKRLATKHCVYILLTYLF